MDGAPEGIEDIVGELERTGAWCHVGWLEAAAFDRIRELARERGFFVREAGWSDRPEQWFEAGRPGVDAATGLGNWAALERDLDAALDAPALFSLLLADINGLGRIARLSPSTAELVVAVVGQAIARLAAGRSVYRVRPRGDEFVVLLEEGASLGVNEIAAGLQRPLPGLRLGFRTRRFRGVTVIGLEPQSGETGRRLLDRAHTEMYEQKQRDRAAT